LRAAASTHAARARRRFAPAWPRLLAFRLGLVFAAVVVVAVIAFSAVGSASTLPAGVTIAGVSVGGLTPAEAEAVLDRHAARTATVPVTFVSGPARIELTPAQIGLSHDWRGAVEAAREAASGPGPVGGIRRLEARVFGVEIAPATAVSERALDYALDRVAKAADRPARDAAVVLRGLRPVVQPAREGRTIDREAAERVVVRALADFSRGAAVTLPVVVAKPTVTAGDLAEALAATRVAVSAPVRLTLGPTRWRLPRWRVAELLALPSGGERVLRIGGPAADRYFERLRGIVDRPPRDATFAAAADGSVSVLPGRRGLRLNRERTADALLAAALSPSDRLARVAVQSVAPSLTTAEAEALGITRVLSSYTTAYAGTADRTHNLQLAISLLDGTFVQPGGTFSLNEAVGERTLARGFREAPVIVNDEYTEGVGGGVSQVATTVFNAAWEAGLKITSRTAHSLYIDRYPLGRDATVNYPDIDLRFVNDTGRTLLVRGFSGSGGITVAIWGAPTNRRVVSEAGPLEETGDVPVRTVRDPSLPVGKSEVEEEGAPPRRVSVERTVSDASGTVLHRETWRTSYRAEPRVVRQGTKRIPDTTTEGDAETRRGAPAGGSDSGSGSENR
jgi:vancomycin resistance protein YoaR